MVVPGKAGSPLVMTRNGSPAACASIVVITAAPATVSICFQFSSITSLIGLTSHDLSFLFPVEYLPGMHRAQVYRFLPDHRRAGASLHLPVIFSPSLA